VSENDYPTLMPSLGEPPCARCGAPVLRRSRVTGSPDGIRHLVCPESHEGAGRLHDALSALRAAGLDDRSDHLLDHMRQAFARTDDGGWQAQHGVLMRARSWCSIITESKEARAPNQRQLQRAALDAVGLLWAWLEWQIMLDHDTAAEQNERLMRLLAEHPRGCAVPDDLRAAAERMAAEEFIGRTDSDTPGHHMLKAAGRAWLRRNGGER
jgi:hypothetical protein